MFIYPRSKKSNVGALALKFKNRSACELARFFCSVFRVFRSVLPRFHGLKSSVFYVFSDFFIFRVNVTKLLSGRFPAFYPFFGRFAPRFPGFMVSLAPRPGVSGLASGHCVPAFPVVVVVVSVSYGLCMIQLLLYAIRYVYDRRMIGGV